MNKLFAGMALSILLVIPAWAGADSMEKNGGNHAGMSTGMTEGQVRKVDKEQGKLTIKHGPLANLGMPPMTMVFRVQDPGMLEKVALGDNIRFLVQRVNGAITITSLEIIK